MVVAVIKIGFKKRLRNSICVVWNQLFERWATIPRRAREPFAVKKKRVSEMTEIDWRFVVVDKTRKCQLTLKYVTRPLIHCTTVLLMYTNKKKLSANRIRSCFGFPAPQIMFTSWEFEWTKSYFEHEFQSVIIKFSQVTFMQWDLQKYLPWLVRLKDAFSGRISTSRQPKP